MTAQLPGVPRQAPTRITIEVHPPDPARAGSADGAGMPIVRVVPDPEEPFGSQHAEIQGAISYPVRAITQLVRAAEPREALPTPAPYEPGPCSCLDDEDCGADHAND